MPLRAQRCSSYAHPSGAFLPNRRELALLSRAAPAPAYAATSAAVSPLQSLDDFEAALEHATGRGHMVVIKFYQVAVT